MPLRPPPQVASRRLGRTDRQVIGVGAEEGLDRLCLAEVVDMGARAVGIDVFNCSGLEARAIQGTLHSQYGPRSILAWGGHVMGIG